MPTDPPPYDRKVPSITLNVLQVFSHVNLRVEDNVGPMPMKHIDGRARNNCIVEPNQ